MTIQNSHTNDEELLPLLCCPHTGEPLHREGQYLITESGQNHYKIDSQGIPLFADQFCSEDARIQQEHYDEIANAYVNNLNYPHTLEYMSYLDDVLREHVSSENLGVCAEICCGTGEGFSLFSESIDKGVGVDVSSSMLSKGKQSLNNPRLHFVQGDATQLPLVSNSFDSVIMLGGIHHVPDRQALFRQISRILKPGGVFIWREPVSDFWLWKFLRAIIYKLSPILDDKTERPLTYNETVPLLKESGFSLEQWRTCGFLGFCFFMNSDVLFFNRLFRFIPGIRKITRVSTHFDNWCTSLPGMHQTGLQVIGKAIKIKTDKHE